MGLSLTRILIFAGIAALVLGGGRLSALMGDAAKRVRSLKKGMTEADQPAIPYNPIEPQSTAARNVRHRPF